MWWGILADVALRIAHNALAKDTTKQRGRTMDIKYILVREPPSGRAYYRGFGDFTNHLSEAYHFVDVTEAARELATHAVQAEQWPDTDVDPQWLGEWSIRKIHIETELTTYKLGERM